MVDDDVLDKVLERLNTYLVPKNLMIIWFWLTHNSWQLPDDITFKNYLILLTSVIKDNDPFYRQIFLEKALFDKQTW